MPSSIASSSQNKGTRPALGTLRIAIGLILLLYLALAIGMALAKAPWCDEGFFASPALNLITKGNMATSVIESASDDPKIKGLDRYTYWVMPLHLVTQAGWYKIFGFSLFSMRSLSIVWGLIALLAWYLILESLTGDSALAVLALGIIATDYVFLQRASDGRMDMMSAALGFSSLAAYLRLRKRNLDSAVLAGNILAAASAFTHPNGGLLSVAALVFLYFYYDRDRIRWYHPVIATIPYGVAALGWWFYIRHDPSLFVTQFGGNASGRFRSLASPLTALKQELVDRYLRFYGWDSRAAGWNRAKILVLLGYAAGAILAFSVRGIRNDPGRRALLILLVIYFSILTLLESTRQHVYLVHIVPLFAAILAISIRWMSARWIWPHALPALVLFGFMALQIAGEIYIIKQNSYGNDYLPAAHFLQKRDANKLIIADSSFLFAPGLEPNLIDDSRLGYRSGKRPDLIVVDKEYLAWFRRFESEQPDVFQHITAVFRNYHEIFKNTGYRIYALAQ